MSTAAPDPAPASPAPQRPAPRIVPPVVLDRVPWMRVGLFVLLSYVILAIFAAPFWFLEDGIASIWFTPVIAVGMWAPAISSLILSKSVERTSWRTRVGLRFRGRWRGIVVWSILAVVLIAAVHALAAVIMVLRGVPGDLTGRTWVEVGTGQIAELTGTDVPAIAFILTMVFSAAVGLVITLFGTLGEEIGWRGWLWPALRPLGRVRAVALMGVIWALWHSPIMLIGYNYPGAARYLAIPMFMLPCIAMSLLFCALTDRAGGSPIPAAWAHAAVNSLGGILIGIFSTTATGAAMNPFVDGIPGVIGVVLVLLVGIAVTPWRRRGPIVRGLPEGTPPGPQPQAQPQGTGA
jgi:membrane protease YdiL (CAAX protease family)